MLEPIFFFGGWLILIIAYGWVKRWCEGEPAMLTHQDWLADLTRRYQEPHRYYHTLGHIAWMFDRARRWEVQLTDAQTLAIWFHDAVYDTSASDNEEKSAELARERLPDHPDIDLICQIILDTKKHVHSCEASKLVLDLDMAILGEPDVEYKRYAKRVRKEFKQYPNDAYNPARISLFLDPTIAIAEESCLFFTEAARQLTEQAVHNLKQERKRLVQS